MYSIGVLSKLTQTKVPTIRYYETIELLSKPERNRGGQRVYDETGVKRLKFIRHMRALGFSIENIRSVLILSERPDMPCNQAHEITSHHLTQVQAKIAALSSLEQELIRITKLSDSGVLGTCRVIESLGDHSACLDAHSEID